MKKYVLSFVFIAFMLKGFSQQEYTLHFSRNLFQSTYTNPAIDQGSRFGIMLPNVVFNYGNNAFSYDDLVKKNSFNDSTYLDIDGVIAQMGDDNVFQIQSNLELIGFYLSIRNWNVSFLFSEKFDFRLSYPKDLFDLAWNGNSKFIGQTIEIGPGMKVNYYKELRIGLGRKIGKWDVGIASKILFGMVNVNTPRDELKLTTGEDNYALTLSTDYEIRTSGTSNPLANFLKIPRSRLNPGFALDLGAIYELNEKWQFSQSFLNLGAIKWQNDVSTYTSNGSFTFSGVDINEFIEGDDDDVNFEKYTDSIQDLYFEESKGGHYWNNLTPESYTSVLFRPDDKTNIGAMIHLTYFYGVQFGSSLYAGRNFFNFLDFGLSWSIKNRRYDNVGFNLAIGPKEYKIFVVTDNLMNFLRARGGRNVTFRYGMNINLGEAQLGTRRKKDNSEPELPQGTD